MRPRDIKERGEYPGNRVQIDLWKKGTSQQNFEQYVREFLKNFVVQSLPCLLSAIDKTT